ncbi:alanine/glycine:cation symporter family protein [Shimia sp. R9_3]|uniref:alanine/glycine:cation symporter family protein n=1 Tax=Shimia sp. R9_3 TaxID=2821113 RepID=UPI001ADBA28D|nr:alanine/glycine:cation symporter family protein [Shimia sp. R9_3]MBO9399782.1 alanine:cation symporter family protein [Shimia sp. R9_3]
MEPTSNAAEAGGAFASFANTLVASTETVVNTTNGILWGYLLIYLLIGCGLFFTLRLGFIQFTNFREQFRLTVASRGQDSAGISPFQALAVSLASRIGTGNLAGVAVAISLGGPGAIFWMWVVALVGMATSFSEATLAQLYKTRGPDGQYRGGPAFYMARGLNMRWLGLIFSIFLVFAFGLVVNGVQSNSIAQAMNEAFDLPKTTTGILLAIATGVVIFGGIRSITRVAEVLVPFMAGAYIIVALYILATNFAEIPGVLLQIVRGAFGLEEAAGGAAGGMTAALLNGVKRGLFSNEAGMGSAPNIAAAATPVPNHPASQGFVQAFGVFIDTILVCTATAVMIIVSGAHKMVDAEGNALEGIAMTQQAAAAFLGPFGIYFIAFAVLLFAFTTIIACYGYAESGMAFLKQTSKARLNLLRLGVMLVVFWGAGQSVAVVFNAADMAIGIMALLNLFALALLSPIVVRVARDYQAQRKAGKTPNFSISEHAKIARGVDADIWK